MKNPCSPVRATMFCLALLSLPVSLSAEPVPLKRIVELALTHATGAAIAAADEQHAAAGMRELHGNYIPQVATGAGLGYSYGFPLALEGTAPSLFNITTQSSLLNPALRDFLRAAKADSHVASLKSKDERNQIIQDAAQSYAELAKWEQRLSRLQEAQSEAEKMETAVTERVKQGVDSEIQGLQARRSAAQVRLHVTEAKGAVVMLRDHLSKLTGLPAAQIQTEPDALPDFPPVPEDDSTPARAAETSPAAQAAVEHARAQYLRAHGEHRGLWPTVDFAAQYALLSKFNNFQDYYIPEAPCATSLGTFLCPTDRFRQNNATIGVSIRFPLFNATQKARAQAADADALKASKQADAVRNQVSEETLRLERSVAQMQAARDLAEVDYEIAEKNFAATQTKADSGTATLHDLDDARTQVNERFIALQDVTFELQRSELGLLRSTGELEKWALGAR
jgi:outer membrane protein TolC